MNKATVASLALEVAALTALVQKLVEANTALEQRASNFAARTTCARKVMVAEITRLRDIVENGPSRVTAAEDRIPHPEFVAALAVLKAETGVGFHKPEVVRHRAMVLREQKVVMQAVDAQDERAADARQAEDDVPF